VSTKTPTIDDARTHGIPLPVSAGAAGRKQASRRPPKRDRLTPDQRLEQFADDNDLQVVNDLLSIARGAGMILDALHDTFSEKSDLAIITAGLSDALFHAADRADLEIYQSAGELVRTLKPEMKAALLRRELRKLKKPREARRG